ncbi:MAG: hypothetical protein EU549_02065, partial [Promethearchaeota archaeon]
MSAVSKINNHFDNLHDVIIICPKCSNKKILQVPERLIQQADGLTTVSIPAGLVCIHSFQAFIDKQYNVRGYQS